MSIVSSVLAMCAAVHAADRSADTGALLQSAKKLGVVGSVLYVAAHPDDENTSLLSYLANEKHVRTAYLSLTRGDGGQNLIGSEKSDDLGIIRTEELLAARRIDGAEQFFTRAKDFGYSKTPEETLAIWGKDEILADIVFVIRKFRPDVIITRFPLAHDEGNHGHHTASARLALEAFSAAADPAFHPEQLQRAKPWKARRILWNKSSFFIKPNEDLSRYIKLDVGVYNPRLGLSYGEMAAESRSMHKSQGFGVAKNRGPILEYFDVLGGDPAKADIFEGVDLSWKRFPKFAGAERIIDLAARATTIAPDAPERIIPTLLEIDRALDDVPDEFWRAEKRRDLGELIARSSGLFAEVSARAPSAVPGGRWSLAISAINRSTAPIRLERVIASPGPTIAVEKPLEPSKWIRLEENADVPATTPYSAPYWLRETPEKGRFHTTDPDLIGLAENPPVLSAEFQFSSSGRGFTIRRSGVYSWTDPVQGERQRPLEIVPPISVAPDTSVLMFPDAKPRPLKIRLKANQDAVKGTLSLELPPEWSADPARAEFTLDAIGAETEVLFHVAPHTKTAGTLRAVASTGGVAYSKRVHHIEHPHIPIIMAMADSEVKLVPLDLARGGAQRIGYIRGAGDEVPQSLSRVGYEVKMLDDDALESGALGGLDAIVVGVRAFNTNPRMRFHHARLMDWVKAGGTLVAQYNTNNWLSKVEGEIGPWPLEIARTRVTDETAAVDFALPKSALIHHPNEITAKDFEGWVQERGLYFAETWDARYEAPLSMHDPGERASTGSVLVARFGKGKFVYTGLAFFRQLPAGVPGAHRLFANMIARVPR